jgi:enamine deaminase RidA (YjgF/YER057c/UK114 family)
VQDKSLISSRRAALPKCKVQTRAFGQQLFVGGVLPVDNDGNLVGPGDIEAQTHAAFRQLKRAIEKDGFQMADLVRLNTYYVYEGKEEEATIYWEQMTRIRLQYFPNPGPAATAVRVKGMGIVGAMIQLEAEAVSTPLTSRQRIMPDKSWDWSIPVPLSQGWKVGNQIWVGGQVSADEAGRATAVGDVKQQARNVLEHIRNILEAAGGDFSHATQIKICYLHDGDVASSETRLGQIIEELSSVCGVSLPPITAFGVNLLYQGLILEIDCTAEIGSGLPIRSCLSRSNNLHGHGAQALAVGQQLQIGGVSPPPENFVSDCENALALISARLREYSVDFSSLSHLHVFLGDGDTDVPPDVALHEFMAALERLCGAEMPPFSLVRVNGLPSNASVQIDGMAVTPLREGSGKHR